MPRGKFERQSEPTRKWRGDAVECWSVRFEHTWGATVGESHLSRIAEEQQRRAKDARTELRAATTEAGCPFPDLEVEPADPRTGVARVDLGMVALETAFRLAEVIRAGVDALAAEDRRPEGTVTHLWSPAVGDLVVDTGSDKVGEFRNTDDSGRWLLAPPAGGDPWLAAPEAVRTAGPTDQVRAEAARATARSNNRVG